MSISEEEIRRLTLEAINELGEKATPDLVKQVVEKSVKSLGDQFPTRIESSIESGRVILTSYGLNKPGVIAAITRGIGEANCDIQDLSQKLMGEFFTMIMIIDISSSPKELKEIQEELNKIAGELNIKVNLQHEDIFRSMHRM